MVDTFLYKHGRSEKTDSAAQVDISNAEPFPEQTASFDGESNCEGAFTPRASIKVCEASTVGQAALMDETRHMSSQKYLQRVDALVDECGRVEDFLIPVVKMPSESSHHGPGSQWEIWPEADSRPRKEFESPRPVMLSQTETPKRASTRVDASSRLSSMREETDGDAELAMTDAEASM
jgi:hypothetical protein